MTKLIELEAITFTQMAGRILYMARKGAIKDGLEGTWTPGALLLYVGDCAAKGVEDIS